MLPDVCANSCGVLPSAAWDCFLLYHDSPTDRGFAEFTNIFQFIKPCVT